ncbi:NUDIX domain-containing protein [Mangrovimonas sp. AS39]|uniref:NUDIX domain-containing protein n=1 Tax=Mangrovimonas futianensis TaxID=2895523 RepID=UPI001E5D4E3D|nr:NUDIX domain-containing protein [Mangrovimonas futianensis]MCF1191600.1 NUDIX domain-containing protein [Mangrovimonas futianensis]MCF1195512.1 NUDIX domain-containing protein [Mangrovimonas futianensis]
MKETKRIKNISDTLLSDHWAKLNKIDFDYQLENGQWIRQSRETYHRGDGAVVLLYNPIKKTVILTRQFRMPAFANDPQAGFMIEACAGMLDKDDPVTCIIREAEEETGFKVPSATKIFEMYSSPGAMTEKLFYFIAEYDDSMKVSDGGGLDSEHEDIEVMELQFKTVIDMLENGEIQDAKTCILLQYAQVHKLME